MNKKKKIILATTLTFIPVTAVVASSLAITISNNKSNLNQNLDSSNAVGNDLISGLNSNNGQNNSGKIDGWLYEGDFYSDFNDIVKKYYENNDSIKSDIYIGDFNKAYNYQNKQLKMEYLRPYDSKKILPVYKKLSGEKTIDFDEAKRSYKYGLLYTYTSQRNAN